VEIVQLIAVQIQAALVEIVYAILVIVTVIQIVDVNAIPAAMVQVALQFQEANVV